ncbi:MAG: VOC family protein [Chloroflexi bacterium]|nr:VOC family protein [Chloroflexota bacterium]
MLYEAISLAILPVSDLAAASAPFERLGLTLSPVSHDAGLGVQSRTLIVGGPSNPFGLMMMSRAGGPAASPSDITFAGAGTARATDTGSANTGDALTARLLARVGGGLTAIVLRVTDLRAALDGLAGRGIQAQAHELRDAAGLKMGDAALLPDQPDAATSLGLVQWAAPLEGRSPSGTSNQNGLRLKRLDHLAAVPPDLERACRFWEETLSIPVVGEVKTPTTVIRQLRIGDAMFELLGPATPDSPIASRPRGLGSMCSFEVDDLTAAVAHARAAGFTAPDPGPGALPGTHTSTIPGTETSGLNLQLLQYL